MPERALGTKDGRQIALLLLHNGEEASLYGETPLGLWDRIEDAPAVPEIRALAHERFGVAESDWAPYTMTIEDMMKAYAMDALDQAQDAYKIRLDLTPESLRDLEAILDRSFQQRPGWLLRRLKQKAYAEELTGVSKVWGAYLGEVIRRHHGGEWYLADDLFPGQGVLGLKIGEISLFPPAKVHKRLTNGEGDNILFYYNVMRERLINPQS